MSSVESNSLQLLSSKVAIIGRPNVGKSTLFNILTDSRKSVVKNQAGVTRDIIIEPVDVWGKKFDLIDTGGVTESQDLFSKLIKEQVTDFLHSVDFIIAVMDGRVGLIPEDRDIIKLAKQTGKPILLVINKVDSQHEDDLAKADFHEFGLDVTAASFEQRRVLAEIMEWLFKVIPEQIETVKDGFQIAMVGKPNVGKSSLLNRLAGEEVAIVTPIAGTTRDRVKESITINGVPMHIIDTAGLRETSDLVEAKGIERSWDAIRTADLVIFLQDPSAKETVEGAEALELKTQILKALPPKCPVLEVGNKSDLLDKLSAKHGESSSLLISAKTGEGIEDLKQRILESVGWGGTQEGAIVARRRHLDCLDRAATHLDKSQKFAADGNISLELFAEELRLAQDQLGQITGKLLPDDLLGKIFSQFCIGK